MAGGARGSSSLPQQQGSSSSISSSSRASAAAGRMSSSVGANSSNNTTTTTTTTKHMNTTNPAAATAATATATGMNAAAIAELTPEEALMELRASEAAVTLEAASASVEAMPTLEAAPGRAALLAQIQNAGNRYSRQQQVASLAAPPPTPQQQQQEPLARFMTDDLAKEYVFSDDPSKQIHGTQYFRKLVSNPDPAVVHSAIDRVIQLGVVPRLVVFLKSDSNAPLQFQAAWVMTNIASGDHAQTQVVVESGAAAWFEKMLVAADEQVREQAAWALGNIAGDSIEFRDKLLSTATVPVLARSMEIYGSGNNMPMIRNAAWLLSKLFRGLPRPELTLAQPALPLLIQFIRDHDDPDVLADSCWALSYICDGPPERIDVVASTPYLIRRVAAILSDTSMPIFVRHPALRIIGNICIGREAHICAIVDEGLMNVLHGLSQYSTLDKEAAIELVNEAAVAALVVENSNLAGAAAGNSTAAEAEAARAEALREGVVAESARRSLLDDGTGAPGSNIGSSSTLVDMLVMNTHVALLGMQLEAVWTLSNISAVSLAQVQGLVAEDVYRTMVTLVKEADPAIAREACWTIANASHHEDVDVLVHLHTLGAIPLLCAEHVLSGMVVHVAIEGLINFLKKKDELAQASIQVAEQITSTGGLARLEALQSHPEPAVYERAVFLLETYFGGEAEE